MKKSVFAVCFCTVLVLICCAGATYATTTYSNWATIASKMTPWTDTLALSKFDTSLGTLTSVELYVESVDDGGIWLENLGPSATTIAVTIKSNIVVSNGSSTLVTCSPTINKSYDLKKYDDSFDWGGDSGVKDLGLAATDTKTVAITDLASYQGVGNVVLSVVTSDASSHTGAANMVYRSDSSADAKARLIFTYEPVPEPTSLVALATGLMGAFGFGLRRKLH